jgi:thiamine biosynthesis protein ThiS
MELVVNGERKQLPDGITAAALLQQLGIQAERVVVEVNLTILKRDQVAATVLNAGDQVEIVHFVGGGMRRITE